MKVNVRKTIRNGIDRRAVYKFRCTGICEKVKSTYVYERAKSGMCLSCSKHQTDPNQDSLFPEGNFTQEHFEALQAANQIENERLDSLARDMRLIPLVINQNQKEAFDKADIDTSNMVLNQPVPTLEDAGTDCWNKPVKRYPRLTGEDQS